MWSECASQNVTVSQQRALILHFTLLDARRAGSKLGRSDTAGMSQAVRTFGPDLPEKRFFPSPLTSTLPRRFRFYSVHFVFSNPYSFPIRLFSPDLHICFIFLP